MTTSVLRGLLLGPVLVLAGCQACVADSSQPPDPPSTESRPAPAGSLTRFRPRPMTPHLLLRDAGAGDE